MKPLLLSVLTSALFFTAPLTYAAQDHALPPGIAWQQGDVDAAFAQARATHKPLFLYWGAVWCPPCNQVKATIFNQQAFIERSAAFIPVYLDGDSDSAQKWGERFKVVGYPTMILFKPDGTEITRLPGEVDAERYMQVLSLGLNATHPVAESLANGLKPKAHLSANEWQMLADYSWDTGDTQLLDARALPVALQTLARHAALDHAPAPALRLNLKAAAAAAGSKDATAGFNKAQALNALGNVLADYKRVRANFDILVITPDDLVPLLTEANTPARAHLVAAWNKALVALAADNSISTTDRLTALDGQVVLAKLDLAKDQTLPDPLLQRVRGAVAAADQATTNGYERQSVISQASDDLVRAGLLDESDALLKAELTRSHAPYYFMLGLAANAKTRGDNTAALNWYEQAWTAAEGPATRLQWGVSYLNNLINLDPAQDAKVQQVASSVIKEAGATPNAFYERSQRSLQRLATGLAKWNADKQHQATVDTLTTQLSNVCQQLPTADPQRSNCEEVVKTARG
ncbi:thioredoxin family protein [Silvimonas sp. JCM 19000]